MPNGHLSGARRAGCMPGGYSLQANFLELRVCELRRIPKRRSSPPALCIAPALYSRLSYVERRRFIAQHT